MFFVLLSVNWVRRLRYSFFVRITSQGGSQQTHRLLPRKKHPRIILQGRFTHYPSTLNTAHSLPPSNRLKFRAPLLPPPPPFSLPSTQPSPQRLRQSKPSRPSDKPPSSWTASRPQRQGLVWISTLEKRLGWRPVVVTGAKRQCRGGCCR